jgi:hypothetical protein
MQNRTDHTALTDRNVINGLFTEPNASASLRATGGVNPSLGGGLSVQQHSTPNMSVDINAGVAYVRGGSVGTQGVYNVLNDALATVSISAADPSLPRIDRVGIQIEDAFYSGVPNDAIFSVVTGTPASSPVAASEPPSFLTLATVRVNAGVTSVTNANITDTRPYINAVGGTFVCTSATRPTNGLYTGKMIYETDTKREMAWSGSAWIPSGPLGVLLPTITASGNSSSTSGTTELIDNIAGTLTVPNVLANRVIRLNFVGRGVNGTTANDRYSIKMRYTTDGSTPTTSSTAVDHDWVVNVANTGSTGVNSANYQAIITPAAGTLKVIATIVRLNGTGTAILVGSVNFFAEDLGSSV